MRPALWLLAALCTVAWVLGAAIEEPAYWPPCGEPREDPRCPRDAGSVQPEDFRP